MSLPILLLVWLIVVAHVARKGVAGQEHNASETSPASSPLLEWEAYAQGLFLENCNTTESLFHDKTFENATQSPSLPFTSCVALAGHASPEPTSNITTCTIPVRYWDPVHLCYQLINVPYTPSKGETVGIIAKRASILATEARMTPPRLWLNELPLYRHKLMRYFLNSVANGGILTLRADPKSRATEPLD